MMNIKTTPAGGRIITGDTRHGSYRVEWDAAGKLVSESMEIRTPDPGPNRTPQTCTHGGEVVDRVPCRSCRGTVKVKVHECAVHGRCTAAKRVEGVGVQCKGCPDFTST